MSDTILESEDPRWGASVYSKNDAILMIYSSLNSPVDAFST